MKPCVINASVISGIGFCTCYSSWLFGKLCPSGSNTYSSSALSASNPAWLASFTISLVIFGCNSSGSWSSLYTCGHCFCCTLLIHMLVTSFYSTFNRINGIHYVHFPEICLVGRYMLEYSATRRVMR